VGYMPPKLEGQAHVLAPDALWDFYLAEILIRYP
jgi:hypothetical protein